MMIGVLLSCAPVITMSDIAIRVEGLSKKYRIGHVQRRHDTLRDQLAEQVTRSARALFKPGPRGSGGNGNSDDTIWALKDVSFEVGRGEVVGIIGRNGAGKSTLLKILSRITEPTEGFAEIHGRLGTLLEVGTGFHPELTGRENIYLSGAIMGMKRAEIERKFDEIVAFAEVEKFIDTPVKHFSSGMYVRLAFAVAAHLEPEILLVDEVLAVGDAAFQKKCLGKMGEVASEGRTVVFVSHNMAAIENLCGRAVLLSEGRVQFIGVVEDCISAYTDSGIVSHGGDIDLSSHPARRPGALPLLRRVRLLDSSGKPKDRFLSGEAMRIEFTFNPVVSLRTPQFGIGVDDWMGSRIFSITTYFSDSELPPLDKESIIACNVDEIPLAPGRYTLSLSAGTTHNYLVDALDNAVSFEIEPVDYFGNGRIPEPGYGRVLIRSHWERQDAP